MKHQVLLVLDECFGDSDPQTCKASLNHRSGNLEATVEALRTVVAMREDDSAATGVNFANEASSNDSQETSDNSSNIAEDNDVGLESVD
ncbi:TPA: hypothetical protein ACH3X2_011874 [Trebouxia sp. C0005]